MTVQKIKKNNKILNLQQSSAKMFKKKSVRKDYNDNTLFSDR